MPKNTFGTMFIISTVDFATTNVYNVGIETMVISVAIVGILVAVVVMGIIGICSVLPKMDFSLKNSNKRMLSRRNHYE